MHHNESFYSVELAECVNVIKINPNSNVCLACTFANINRVKIVLWLMIANYLLTVLILLSIQKKMNE